MNVFGVGPPNPDSGHKVSSTVITKVEVLAGFSLLFVFSQRIDAFYTLLRHYRVRVLAFGEW